MAADVRSFFQKICGHLRTPADTLRTKPEDKCPQALLVCPQYVRRCPQYVLRVRSVSAGMSAGMSAANPWMNEFFVPCESFVCPSYVLCVSAGVLCLSFVCPSFVRGYIPWMNELGLYRSSGWIGYRISDIRFSPKCRILDTGYLIGYRISENKNRIPDIRNWNWIPDIRNWNRIPDIRNLKSDTWYPKLSWKQDIRNWN